ncbi:MAG: rod shape-determining protein MreC [Bacteroidales bacterium]|nr:rod shape-determining protein MreC [Bacteroidales bacterium]
MNNLIRFLAKKMHWLVFFMLEIMGLFLYLQFNRQQGVVIFSSVNTVVGSFYQVVSSLGNYFNLKEENSLLHDKNVALNFQIAKLREQLQDIQSAANPVEDVLDTTVMSHCSLIKARVINNSLFRKDNFITLDKGEADGVSKEMGVIDSNGVVGVVYMTSEHYSLVLSLLSSRSSINCKVAMTEFFGILKWERESFQYASVYDLPQHSMVEKGDKIVTNGFSIVFPVGMPIGEVESILEGDAGQSCKLKIKLAVDFSNLRDVYVLNMKSDNEKQDLESLAK